MAYLNLPFSPGGGSSPAPATTVVGPDAYGASPVVGTATLYARADHDHGLPAAPAVPNPATTVVGPDAYGASPVVGTATLYARADHDHGLPAAPAASLTSIYYSIPADINVSATTITNILTPSFTVGTWLFSVSVTATSATVGTTIGVSLYNGTATYSAVGQHSAYCTAESSTGYYTFGFTTLVIVTAAGTVPIDVEASSAATVKASGSFSMSGSTGYVAVKIA